MPPSGRSKDAWRGAAANSANSTPGLPGTRKAAGNPRRWFLAALVVLGLAGIIAGIIFFIGSEKDPVLLALPVTQYEDPSWPANPWAEAEAGNYRERFGDVSTQNFPDQTNARLLGALTKLAEDSRGEQKGRPIVAVVTIQGIAVNGVAYLLPGDAKPNNPATWLKLAQVLEPLRKAEVPRLLVLDVRPVNSPHSVQPTSDVNDELDAELTKLEAAGDLPFLVLNAATPSVGPAAVRPLKRTVFGLALNQGLGGHADGWNPGRDKDLRVNARELAEYVRETTYNGTVAFGHPPQLPKLYGTGKDFFLRHVPRGGAVALPAIGDPEPLPPWLDESAKFHDAWVKGGGHLRLPKVAVDGSLARVQAEGQCLGGYNPAAVESRFKPAEEARRRAMAATPAVVPPVNTLARHRQNKDFAAKVEAAKKLLDPVFNKIRDGGGKPEEFKAVLDPVVAKGLEQKHPPEAICEAALKFALALEDVKFDQILRIASTVAGFNLESKPAEWITFEFVAAYRPDLAEKWPKGTLRSVLLYIPGTGEATATDGRNLPWLRRALEDNAAKATAALIALGDPKTPEARLREVAPALDEAGPKNVLIKAAGVVLTELRTEYEEARAELSDLSAEFPHEFANNPALVASTWAALVDAFSKAEKLLTPPDGAAGLPALEPVQQARNALLAARTALRGMVIVPASAGVRQLERALAWPGWNDADRTALLKRYDAQSLASTTRLLNSWTNNPSGLAVAAPAKTFKVPVVTTPPVAGLVWSQPQDEAEYQGWLGRTYYQRAATEWRKLKPPAAAKAATDLERIIVRSSLDWAANAPR